MGVLGRLLAAARKRPGPALAIAAGTMVSSAGQVLVLASAYPLLTAVLGGGGLDRLPAWLGASPPATAVAVFLCVAAAVGAAAFVVEAFQNVFLRRYEEELRGELARSAFASEWGYLRGLGHGRLVNLMSTEADNCKVALKLGLAALDAALQAAALAAFAFWLQPAFTSASVALFAVTAALSLPFLAATRRAGEERVKGASDLAAAVLRLMRGAKALKALSLEEAARPSLSEPIARLAGVNLRLKLLGAGQAQLNEFVGLALLAGLLALGRWGFGLGPAPLLILLGAVVRALPQARQALNTFSQAAAFSGSAAAVDLVLSESAARRQRSGGETLSGPFRSLRFEAASLTHPGAAAPAVDKLSYEIAKGEYVLVAGPTGAGKTTVLDLLLGLLTPDSGRVLVNGRDMRELDLASWRARLAFLPQEPTAFEGTVRENLCWGMSPAPDEARLRRALEDARLGRLLEGPGLERRLIEGGGDLSGGEKQRLALARAFLRDAEVLVCDEPTSALDAGTTAEILELLGTLKGRVTAVIVSHDARFRELCGRVLELGNAP